MRYTALLALMILSCQEDTKLKNICADPIGSKDVYMKHNTLFCFSPSPTGSYLDNSTCFLVEFTATTQLFKAKNYSGTLLGSMVDVGLVTCLGGVNTIPSSGYTNTIEVVEKHGYVVKLPDNTYGRLFVHSWTKPSSGAVSEIRVTWQHSF